MSRVQRIFAGRSLGRLAPLVRCLPECRASLRSSIPYPPKCYSFRRSLTRIEWEVLRSYTRRVRSIFINYDSYNHYDIPVHGLNRKSLGSLPFPNLRYLRLEYIENPIPLFRLPLPSLVSLEVELYSRHLFEDSLASFARITPSLTRLFVDAYHYAGIDMNNIDPSFIRQWRNLQIVVCREIHLDVTTLVHLSRMPALTRLSFTLRSTLLDQISESPSESDLPFFFSNLRVLTIYSESLGPVSRFLSRARLVTKLTVVVKCRPSKQDLASFLESIQTSGIGQTIQELWLHQEYILGRTYVPSGDRPVLGLEDLRPCMAFSHLRRIELDIEYQVDMTDSSLLTLTSAWSRLQHFRINASWGWNTPGGMTPDGLARLLHTRRSLTRIAFAIDTRGYTETKTASETATDADGPRSLASLEQTSSLPHPSIDVVDSFIEAESVPAMAAFFARRCKYLFHGWNNWELEKSPSVDVYKIRWEDVCKRIEDAVATAGRS
ncbi:hypothetical protein L210DRAFT_2081178 [Boletus edulis BED1]|uniref:Uncharacterized protein n=1 Tax=Boletus edulis BED1 TaxID=1328754 RepID=A0AAD4BWY5_BOLED|nr:hypothetical protein L210DRAFT_2081178 [Boletus edulis BED1]